MQRTWREHRLQGQGRLKKAKTEAKGRWKSRMVADKKALAIDI